MGQRFELSAPFAVHRARRFATGSIPTPAGTTRKLGRVRWAGPSGDWRGAGENGTLTNGRPDFPAGRPGAVAADVPRHRRHRPEP